METPKEFVLAKLRKQYFFLTRQFENARHINDKRALDRERKLICNKIRSLETTN